VKWAITIIAILLIVGHFQTSISARIVKIWPELSTKYIKPVINPPKGKSFDWYRQSGGINILWWLKYNCEEFLWVIVFYCFAMIARLVSFRVFMICCVFFIYHLIDWFCLWYDYKTSSLSHWGLDIFCLVSVICLFFREQKLAIVKSME
jgi:hypothetical protein